MQNSTRYQVIRKLGDGSYSTVWLAIDKEKSKNVAVKKLKRRVRSDDQSKEDMELKIWKYIQGQKESVLHAGARHIISFLGHYESANGNENFVLEPVDGNIAKNLYIKLAKVNNTRKNGFPLWVTKTILRQTLWGMDFLHQLEIVHGDLHAGNILYKVDAHARLSIKLTDFGSAFFLNDPPSHVQIPNYLRAPELIVHDKFDQAIDIWSFGCLMFELITKTHLFELDAELHGEKPEGGGSRSSRVTRDLSHLYQMINLLGNPAPDSNIRKWISRHDADYGKIKSVGGIDNSITLENDGDNDNGNKNNKSATSLDDNNSASIGGISSFSSSKLNVVTSLEEKFSKSIPEGSISTGEGFVIISILRDTLQYDKSMRTSFADLLRQSWFFSE